MLQAACYLSPGRVPASLSDLPAHLAAMQSQVARLREGEQHLRAKLSLLLKNGPRTEHIQEILGVLACRHSCLVEETQKALQELTRQVQAALGRSCLAVDSDTLASQPASVRDQVAALKSCNLALARDFHKRLQRLEATASLRLREAEVNAQHARETIRRQVQEIHRLTRLIEGTCTPAGRQRLEYGLRLVSATRREQSVTSSDSRASRWRDRRRIFERQPGEAPSL